MDAAQLKAAGFTDKEIQLHQAGFSDDEIKAASVAPVTVTAPKKPATLGSTLGRAAWNLPMDTAETLKGVMQQFGPEGIVAQSVMHPVKAYHDAGNFVDNAATILGGGLAKLPGNNPAIVQGKPLKVDTAPFDKFAGDFHDNFLTKQGIYKNVGDHPAGTDLAIASILDPALRAGGVDGGIVGATDRAVTGTADAIKARIPAPTPKPVPPPTVSQLKTTASQLYDRAKDAGVVINGQSFANFADDLRNSMKEQGIDKDLHPKASAAVRRISETGGDVSLNDLEILRKIAGDAGGAVDKADKRLARMVVDHIDDYAENLQPHNIIAGDAPKAVALLKEARSTWQNAARGETIENLISKARQNGGAFKSNIDAAYRQQFKKLANSDRGMARFSPEQQDAIRKVAYGDGPVQSMLHAVGRIIPSNHSGVLTTSGVAAGAHILGAPVTGPVGATVGAAGMAGKVGSAMITSKNAQRASELARGARSEAYQKIAARRAARIAKTGGQ